MKSSYWNITVTVKSTFVMDLIKAGESMNCVMTVYPFFTYVQYKHDSKSNWIQSIKLVPYKHTHFTNKYSFKAFSVPYSQCAPGSAGVVMHRSRLPMHSPNISVYLLRTSWRWNIYKTHMPCAGHLHWGQELHLKWHHCSHAKVGSVWGERAGRIWQWVWCGLTSTAQCFSTVLMH